MTDKSLEDLDIQHVKLTDGTEIIGYINSIDKNIIVMERPMLINSFRNTNGYDTYFFTKYMPFTEINLVKINSTNIIATSTIRDEIKEKYIRAAISDNSKEEEEYEEYMEEEELDELEDTFLAMMPTSRCIH